MPANFLGSDVSCELEFGYLVLSSFLVDLEAREIEPLPVREIEFASLKYVSLYKEKGIGQSCMSKYLPNWKNNNSNYAVSEKDIADLFSFAVDFFFHVRHADR